jgi:hypothetical protein
LRRPTEGIEYPENNAADNDKVDVAENIKSNQVVRQISAPLSSTNNVVDMDTKNQVVNYISNKRSSVIWRIVSSELYYINRLKQYM